MASVVDRRGLDTTSASEAGPATTGPLNHFYRVITCNLRVVTSFFCWLSAWIGYWGNQFTTVLKWVRVVRILPDMRGRNWGGVAALALAGVVVLSACGGSSAPSPSPATTASPTASGTPAEVAQAVAEAENAVQWRLSAAPSISVGTNLQGKKVAIITRDINPFIQTIKDGITEANTKAGMTTLESNPAGSAADVARQVSQAIAQKASAVITIGFPTEEISGPIQEAHDAGLSVVQLFVTDPGLPSAAAVNAGVFAFVSPCYSCIGKTMADIVIQDSGGKANVVFINAPDVGIATLEAEGFKSEMQKHCPECTVKVSDAPIAQWGTLIPGIATAAASDPNVNYVVPVFDTASPLIVPALSAANATDRVKLVSSNGDQAQLQDMKSGSAPKWVGNVGVNAEWIGWASTDQVFRALLNQPALPDEQIGARAFTPANVTSIDLTASPSSWYGYTDFKAGYLKLWGFS